MLWYKNKAFNVLTCIVLLSCNSGREQKPVEGNLGRYLFPLGMMYGSFSSVDETINEDNGFSARVRYEFSIDKKQLKWLLDTSATSTYHYDDLWHIDSVVTRVLGDTPSVAISNKTDYCTHYVFFIKDKVSDTLDIRIDTARRTVQLFRRGQLHAIDSFNASGLLVQSLKPRLQSVESYKYDERGNRICLYMKLSARPGDYREVTYEYKYDSQGNWTERTEHFYQAEERKKFVTRTRRVIKYD